MISKTTLQNIASGQQRGFVAAAVRGVLWMLVPVYLMIIKRRNRHFDQGKANIGRVDVPVISIGNLTTGGTGKTPLVIWICQYIRSNGIRAAIVSRGYGAGLNSDGSAKRNDEAVELEQRLPDVPHLQNPDRLAAATIAVVELESQAIVIDDGFQHRSIARDLDVVVVDATLPFGYEYLLPRGLLREPVANIGRADFVVVSRSDQISQDRLDSIVATLRRHHPAVPIAMTRVQPSWWLQFDRQQHPLTLLKDCSVHLCCAIGNPDSFLATAAAVGSEMGQTIAGHTFFDDHHLYQRADLDAIVDAAKANGATAIICTHKDLVKIGVNQYKGLPFYALVTELQFVQGRALLVDAIDSTLKRMGTPTPQ
jgi:tetraacyldisaccharide 4'-kinase